MRLGIGVTFVNQYDALALLPPADPLPIGGGESRRRDAPEVEGFPDAPAIDRKSLNPMVKKAAGGITVLGAQQHQEAPFLGLALGRGPSVPRQIGRPETLGLGFDSYRHRDLQQRPREPLSPEHAAHVGACRYIMNKKDRAERPFSGRLLQLGVH
jgi:hypothetical protein